MKSRVGPALLLLGTGAALSWPLHAQNAAVARGRTLFAQQCAACHALDRDGMGPPLGGVTTLLTESQLAAWVAGPPKIVATGDVRANALVRRYKMVMPSFAYLEPGQVADLFAYIDRESAARHLTPFAVNPNAAPAYQRWFPPPRETDLAVELEDVVQIPRLPGRTPYKGITLLRPDPREKGALLVLDLMGIIYRVEGGRLSVFLDMRKTFPRFIWDPGVATGLGSFALDPGFVRNGIFYTTHAETFRGSPAINSADIPPDTPKGATPPLEWVLTEWRLADPASPTFSGTHREVLRFVTPTTAHGSQEIAFAPVPPGDPDYGLLYLAVGDGGSVNLKRPDLAGHPRTLLGSILRIDPKGRDGANGRYGIPPDNPFAGSRDPRVHREIWAYGFRNPHRMSWDLAYGKRMIVANIGESNAETVDLVERGGDYGWGAGLLEGTLHIDAWTDAKSVRPATPAELAHYALPFGEYDHSEGNGAAIAGGYVYRGPLQALRDKYIFGDIVTGQLFFMNFGPRLTDHAIYKLNIVRDGRIVGLKALARLDRAHLRLGYDDRTGDLYLTTKEDGMVRKIVAAYDER